MNDVISRARAAIVGTYTIPPREDYLKSFEELAESVTMGLVGMVEEESGRDLHRRDIEAWFLASGTAPEVIGNQGQRSWEASLFANFGVMGRLHVSVHGLEALHHAIHDIRSGECSLVFVGGFDKRSDEDHIGDIADKGIDPNLRLWNWDWKSVYSWQASKYMSETGVGHDELMSVAVNDTFNARTQRKAPLGDFLGMREKSLSRPLYDPLTVFDFATTRCDGGAALLLCRPDRAREFTESPVYITASESITGPSEFWSQEGHLAYPALTFAMEGVTSHGVVPEELDLVSVDTKATIIAPLALEGLGLMPFPSLGSIHAEIERCGPGYRGSHIHLNADSGHPFIMNANGGTYVCGNIPGVQGLYRVAGMVEQLQGRSPFQAEGPPRTGIVQEQSVSGVKQLIAVLETEA